MRHWKNFLKSWLAMSGEEAEAMKTIEQSTQDNEKTKYYFENPRKKKYKDKKLREIEGIDYKYGNKTKELPVDWITRFIFTPLFLLFGWLIYPVSLSIIYLPDMVRDFHNRSIIEKLVVILFGWLLYPITALIEFRKDVADMYRSWWSILIYGKRL